MSGIRLAQAEDATRGDSVRLTNDEREFLDSSLAHRDAAAAAERMRHARELNLERRARVRLRGLVAVLTAGLVIAAGLTALAVNRSREAENLRIESQVTTLTSASVASLESDPELSLLLVLNAIDAVPPGDRVPTATVETLHWAIQEAGIEYPANAPVAVVAGPLGTRGIVNIPLPHLVEAARAHIRALTHHDCARFEPLGVTCDSVRGPLATDLIAEPVRALEPADPNRALAGTQVTIFDVFDKPWIGDFEDEVQRFSARTGIEVRAVHANDDFEPWLRARVAAGDSPDLALFPQPGSVAAFATESELVNLGAYVDADRLATDQSPYLVSLGTVGSDGSWPTGDGRLYGAFVDLNDKSLIYYLPPEMRAAGYHVPTTWDDLITLSNTLVAEGRTPWCIGFESGAADGWPGTDWVENLVLRAAGPRAYDRWAFHEIRFDALPVRTAFQRLGEILFGKGYVHGGTEAAVQTPFYVSEMPMVEQEPPGCWLTQSATFMAKLFPRGSIGSKIGAFPFPSIDGRFNDAMLGGGDIVGAFSDRPEVRQVVRWLLSTDYGAEWAGRGHGWISANRQFELSKYTSFERGQAELIVNALEGNAFRFDASDLMPPAIGQGLFWESMMHYLEDGPDSLDGILADLDAAWPDDG